MRVIPPRISSKPQYVLHPTRAARRALHRFASPGNDGEVAQLPWGLDLLVQRSDAIGYSILTGGVFDPCVSETMYRLIDPGDAILDVGANIGYLTSLAAARSGRAGRVIAYEPNPSVFAMLQANADRWRSAPNVAQVQLRQVALSSRAGTAELSTGPAANMGLSSLEPDEAHASTENVVQVALARLDDDLPLPSIGLLKIDVEGHEADVLSGATELLRSGSLRDIVFEDHDDYPSRATQIVEAAGYRLLSLDNTLSGLRLCPPAKRGEVSAWPGPSYLATRDLARAEQRLRPRGWLIRGIGPSVRLPRLGR
jgi:FkbM family methyltransferase